MTPRKYNLKYKYGLSEDAYWDLFEAQDGKCAICLESPGDKWAYLTVDHCHDSDRIRGLLCRTCNSGLGMFHDDVLLVERALKYVKS